eukprot:3723062-Rhodomonas_salina.2
MCAGRVAGHPMDPKSLHFNQPGTWNAYQQVPSVGKPINPPLLFSGQPEKTRSPDPCVVWRVTLRGLRRPSFLSARSLRSTAVTSGLRRTALEAGCRYVLPCCRTIDADAFCRRRLSEMSTRRSMLLLRRGIADG